MQPRRLLRLPPVALAVALAIGSVLAGSLATPGPPATRGGVALPACRYLDLPTRFTNPADWRRTLVDTLFRVPAAYLPSDLVAVSEAGVEGTGQVRQLVIPDLTALAAAAREAGTPVAVQSAYRSYAYQVETFNSWAAAHGYDSALEGSARPGHSEHQLGVALDFLSAGGGAPWDVADWATTPAGRWMEANAWQFGFVMSYPEAKAQVTCYAYEPWHYRFVGREIAAAIHESGLTPREYLWDQLGNSVMADLVPGAAASVEPSPAAQRTPVPSLQPSVAPSPTARASERTESGVGAATGGPGAGPDPIPVGGVALSVAIGLVILVAVEQLDRVIRRRVPRAVPRARRRGSWDQARRSSSFPSP